jgi:hypothetical protein
MKNSSLLLNIFLFSFSLSLLCVQPDLGDKVSLLAFVSGKLPCFQLFHTRLIFLFSYNG